jgi:hypothetical protein
MEFVLKYAAIWEFEEKGAGSIGLVFEMTTIKIVLYCTVLEYVLAGHSTHPTLALTKHEDKDRRGIKSTANVLSPSAGSMKHD